MKHWYLILFAGLILASGPGSTIAQDLRPADFAYGIRIDTVGRQPVQAFELPRAVYEHLTRDDLGDLRVFNGDGTPVPHALHHAEQPPGSIEQSLAVPFFPIYGTAGQSLGDLGIQVQRTGAGTLVRIDEQQRAPQQTLRAYIVDASQVHESVNRLTFDWPSAPENLMASVSVETSADLAGWQSWGAASTLTSMRHNESVLVRNTIDLPARRANYYRISWPLSQNFPPVDQMIVSTVSTGPKAERHWAGIPLVEEGAGVYSASIPGTIPADRVEIELPEAQTVVRITVESAPSADGPWTHHFSGLAYNLQAGDDQWKSPPISIYRNTHRYWRLTVDRDASSVMLGAPSLRFGWVPARLLFVPQGPPPYTLAFGNASAQPAGFQSVELFGPVAARYGDVFDLPAATIGAVSELGGEERLRQPAEVNWRQLVLWGTMIAGVLILGLMALRLVRKTGEEI